MDRRHASAAVLRLAVAIRPHLGSLSRAQRRGLARGKGSYMYSASAAAIKAPLDPHSLLGVSTACTEAELKAAFRKLAVQWHPDKFAGGG
eukprot:SAG22_NODE_13414_length_407_cov_1.340909_1_plen_89_part_01